MSDSESLGDVREDAIPVQTAAIQDSASSMSAREELVIENISREDNRVKYSRDELLAIGKEERCMVFPQTLDLETNIEFRDLDKRVESSALDDVPLKPQWAGFANRGPRPGPPGFGGPPHPFRSRLIDDPTPQSGPEPSHSPPGGPSPWGRAIARAQEKEEKWHEPWNAHYRDRPGEHRGERMADGRGRWGDKPPVADSWRGKDDRWGPPGGDRGAHRGERDRDGPMGGGRDAMGRAPRRWEEGHDWDRRPERRSDHHELGTSPSDNWSDPNTTKPRGAMTHLDIERERQAFREQHSKQAQAGGKQEPRGSDLNALFAEEVDLEDLMDEEQRTAKGLVACKPGAPHPSAAPAPAPQGIKMTFMDLAKAAAGAGAGGDKPEGPPSGLPNGKVVSLDDLEKRQLTAGGVPADVAQDAKLARGGAPAAGAKGPPPGMVAPPPGFKPNAQASQTLMGLLRKAAPPPADSTAAAPSAAPPAAPAPPTAPATAPAAVPAPAAAPPTEPVTATTSAPATEPAKPAPPAASLPQLATTEPPGFGSLLAAPPGIKPAGGLSLSGGLSTAFSTGGGLLGTSIPSSVFSAFGQSKPDEQLAAISSIWASTPAPATTTPAATTTNNNAPTAKPAPPTSQSDTTDTSSKPAEQPSASGAGSGPGAAAGQQNPLAALFARAAAQQGQGCPVAGAAAGMGARPPDATMAALLSQLNQAQQQQHQQQQSLQQQPLHAAGQQQKSPVDELLRMMDASKQGGAGAAPLGTAGPGGLPPGGLPGLQGKQGPGAPGAPAGNVNPAQKQLADLLAGLRTAQSPQPMQPSQEQLMQLLASGAMARQQQQQQQQQQMAAGMQQPGAAAQNLLEQHLLQLQQQQRQQQAAAMQAQAAARPHGPGAGFNPQLLAQLQQAMAAQQQQRPGMTGMPMQGGRQPIVPTMQPGAPNMQALNLQLLQAQAQARGNPAAQSGAQFLQAMQAQAQAAQNANSLARFFNPAALQAAQAPRMPYPVNPQQQNAQAPTNLAELEKLLQRR